MSVFFSILLNRCQKATVCKLFPAHNHSVCSAAALSKHPVNEETKAQLELLYSQHMQPNTALTKLKENMTPAQLADRAIAPDYKYANQ